MSGELRAPQIAMTEMRTLGCGGSMPTAFVSVGSLSRRGRLNGGLHIGSSVGEVNDLHVNQCDGFDGL